MYTIRKNGATSNVLRATLRSSSTGAGLTGLTSASSGLIISTICDNEATATAYTAGGSTIDTITTLGTYAAPSANHCRFKEVDATNHPGLYEIQLADARFAVSSAKLLRITISGATSLLAKDIIVQLSAVDPDSAAGFMTGVNSLAPPTNWNLHSIDSNGRVDVIKIAGTPQTARDLGTSVLLSAGTGTGQVNLSGGNVTLTDASLTTAKLGAFVLAKTTNITGFNDIAAGAQMDLVNAPNATAITAIQSGLATSSALSTLQTSVNNINNLSALANLFAPDTLVRPSSSSIVYPITFVVKDVEGHLVDVDTNAVTLTATNAAGTDRSANLSAVTHAGTGEYTFTYTVSSAHASEGLRLTAAGTVQSASRKAYANIEVADANSLTALAAIQAKTDQLTFTVANVIDSNTVDWKGATAPAMTGDAFARLGAPAGASVSVDIAAVKSDSAAIKTKTDNLPASPAATGDIPTVAQIAAGLLDLTAGVETSLTLRQALRGIAAVMLGKSSGSGANFRDTNDTKTRIAATLDSSGNRTAITLDLT